MPIVVTTPVQGDAVGPGTFVRASTQSVLPVGHHWDSLIFQPGTQDELSGSISFVEGQSNEQILNVRQVQPGQREAIWMPQLAQPATGAEFELHVRVVSAQSTILDTSGPIGVVWRPDPAGVAYVQSLQAQPTTGDGSFLPSDRLNLDSVLASVQLVSPPALTGGANIVAGIIDFVRGPPRSFLRRFGSLTLTGRGTFSAQPPGALHSFGGTWSFVTIPAGYGRDDGALVEYHRRLAQFVVVRDEVTSDTYLDVLEDSHYEGNFILWQFPNPLQIQYDIAPGVVVLWQWLV